MRSNLAVEDLGGLLDEPIVAVLATYRSDGTVLLSPVWFEWRDGGFNVWVIAESVKHRHLQRDPRASLVVAESALPLRAVEVRGQARIVTDGAWDSARRISARYMGQEGADALVGPDEGRDVIVRLEPGDLRAWDFADNLGSLSV
jgi:PPOX class probable F420-dependent enzyme